MHRYFFEFLTALLFGGSIFFFIQCIDFLTEHRYIEASFLLIIGIAIIAVGRDMARIALAQKE